MMGALTANIAVLASEIPVTSTVPNPRKAHIAGGNAILFRFNNVEERELGSLGIYTKTPTESPAPSPIDVAPYAWPNQPENSVVDLENVSLWVVAGLLNYYFDANVVTVPNAGINILQTNALVFVSNDAADRDLYFLDRDCQVDDSVTITVGEVAFTTIIREIRMDDAGEYKLLVLRDDLPAAIRAASVVALSLSIPVDEVEIPHIKEEAPGEFNYTFDVAGIMLADEITMFEDSWASNGVMQPLPLIVGEIIVQYRAWVENKTNAVYTCTDLTDLALIPGGLHPANPLKWGVYLALLNSAGVEIKYTAVADPHDVNDWVLMLEWLEDHQDIYVLVPLTADSDVWAAYQEYIVTRRAVGQPLCARFCPNLQAAVVKYDDINATIMEYEETSTNTLVTATTGAFITDNIEVGDIVDFEFELDAWGRTQYESAVVTAILSEQSLLIDVGPDTAVAIPARIRIKQTSNTANIVSRLLEYAATYDNRYATIIWPDSVTVAGYASEGYYLAAALGGARSGVYPHQGLSHSEIIGITADARMRQLSATQRTALSESGVWVVNETPAGKITTRRGVTTAQTDELDYREEAIVSNIDGIEYDIRRIIQEYKGKSNVTKTILRHTKIAIRQLFIELGADVDELLGPRIFDGTVNSVIMSEGSDTVVVDYSITVPTPFNKLEIVQQIIVGLSFEDAE